MKTVGMVCEFNPFHKGHAYFIQEAKERSGADVCIVVMSEHFTQDGTPAVFPARLRTEAALLSGADLVFSLPFAVSTASAGEFAKGAVFTLNLAGPLDYLAFGSETEELSSLLACSALELSESPLYQKVLRDCQKAGLSYPAAKEQALKAVSPDISLPGPNARLGIEYLKALPGSTTPLPILRKGSEHGKEALSSLSSGRAIRKVLLSGTAKDAFFEREFPPDAGRLFLAAYQSHDYVSPEDLMPELCAALSRFHFSFSRDMAISHALSLDVPEYLIHKIENLPLSYYNYEELVSLLHSRSFTDSRIRRSLLSLAVPLPDGLRTQWRKAGCSIPYLKLSGFSPKGRDYLHNIKKSLTVPLLVRPKDAETLLTDPLSRLFWEADLSAGTCYHRLRHAKHVTVFSEGPVRISD